LLGIVLAAVISPLCAKGLYEKADFPDGTFAPIWHSGSQTIYMARVTRPSCSAVGMVGRLFEGAGPSFREMGENRDQRRAIARERSFDANYESAFKTDAALLEKAGVVDAAGRVAAVDVTPWTDGQIRSMLAQLAQHRKAHTGMTGDYPLRDFRTDGPWDLKPALKRQFGERCLKYHDVLVENGDLANLAFGVVMARDRKSLADTLYTPQFPWNHDQPQDQGAIMAGWFLGEDGRGWGRPGIHLPYEWIDLRNNDPQLYRSFFGTENMKRVSQWPQMLEQGKALYDRTYPPEAPPQSEASPPNIPPSVRQVLTAQPNTNTPSRAQYQPAPRRDSIREALGHRFAVIECWPPGTPQCRVSSDTNQSHFEHGLGERENHPVVVPAPSNTHTLRSGK
jgi:hypothetical protein